MTKYIPPSLDWVRKQVELYESSGGTKGTTLLDTGLPCIIVTHLGGKTGATRKIPLMRVKVADGYVFGRLHGRTTQESCLGLQPSSPPGCGDSRWYEGDPDARSRSHGRAGTRAFVGGQCRCLSALQRLSGEDDPEDPGLRRRARLGAGAAGRCFDDVVVRPRIVLVTGRPGSGKSTLARELSQRLRLPLLARDDVRGGLFFSAGAWEESVERIPSGEEAVALFIASVELLARGGASCVVEYVLRANRPVDLERLIAAGDCVAIMTHCDKALDRFAERNRRDPLIANKALLSAVGCDSVEAHTTNAIERMRQVERDMLLCFPFPLLHVDTTDGCAPTLPDVLEFVVRPSAALSFAISPSLSGRKFDVDASGARPARRRARCWNGRPAEHVRADPWQRDVGQQGIEVSEDGREIFVGINRPSDHRCVRACEPHEVAAHSRAVAVHAGQRASPRGRAPAHGRHEGRRTRVWRPTRAARGL